jgi:hypothetical protein
MSKRHEHFTEENIQIANKLMASHLTSFVIRELQVETTGRSHYTPIQMAKNFVNSVNTNASEDAEKLDYSHFAGEKSTQPVYETI